MNQLADPDIELQAPVTADNFKPVFLDNVTTTNINGVVTPVNPVFCLTRRSAEQLAIILKDLVPQIVFAFPQNVAAGIRVSILVPWFRFPSGAAVNCGLEGNFWSNDSGASAESKARQDIKAATQKFYVEGPEQYPPQLRTAWGA